MVTEDRNRDRKLFNFALRAGMKIQVGARGQKNGAEWTAIDLFDNSPLIDHNWDLQNLPLGDETAECFVCNAVLEHLPHPDVAVYEMWRTLRPGGQIWVEVPFLQFYHAHPFDFYRWTVAGLNTLMSDFIHVKSGIGVGAGYEARKFVRYLNSDAQFPIDEALVETVVGYVELRERKWKNPRFYSSVYFWGEKPLSPLPRVKIDYMEYVKSTLSPALS